MTKSFGTEGRASAETDADEGGGQDFQGAAKAQPLAVYPRKRRLKGGTTAGVVDMYGRREACADSAEWLCLGSMWNNSVRAAEIDSSCIPAKPAVRATGRRQICCLSTWEKRNE